MTIIELSLLVGFLLGLIFLMPLQGIILWMSTLKATQFVARHFKSGTGADNPTNPAQSRQVTEGRFRALREILRTTHGWRWRYRHPWLLLTGDASTVARLLPAIQEPGWLNTGEAILLWNNAGEGGQPDAAWLQQLRKLRRRRPIDAVIVVQDGTAQLAAQRRGVSTDSLNLSRFAEVLKWSAPVYALDVAETAPAHEGATPLIGCEFDSKSGRADATAIANALMTLRDQLSERGIAQIIADTKRQDTYTAKLSQRLDDRIAPLAAWIASLSGKQRSHQPIGGAFFAPYPQTTDKDDTQADLPLWHHLGQLAQRARGCRVGFHPVTVFSTVMLLIVGTWTAGLLISAATNAREVHLTNVALQDLKATPDTAASLRALLGVQHRIELYEHRISTHAPFWTRFGLNQDRATLAALWQPYGQAADRLLIAPIAHNIEAELVDLAQMPTDQLDDTTNQLALEGHHALKAYLMLAEPSRADAAFLTPQLTRHWRTSANLSPGAKLDLSERLLSFYAQHLKVHEAWRVQPQQDLVNEARQTLLAVIVVKNSEDTVYQSLLDAVGNKYPDQTLATLTAGTDPRGLLRTGATIPGVFTRQAYEGSIQSDIDKVAERSAAATDWVLNTHTSSEPEQGLTGDALKAELTARYFADYADHWQAFMNSLQWESAPTMPAAIEQLKPMADARQSPVIALMKALEYQGKAGAPKATLSDTLVAKAQNVFGKKNEDPQAQRTVDPAGPLGPAFGPVLRLVAQGEGANNAPSADSDLSLQRYLARVTALRLKLQQISNSPNADTQAKQVALALFQGKGSDLADIQDYAQQVAASLGAQWAGMGEALFVRPVAQATQTVLQPAQASLNDAWGQTIVATWNKSFAGRYPFASTDNDASLPELARFLRPQGGLISAFLSTQLAGVLELQGDRWVPAGRAFGTAAGGDSLAFDPAFLKAINTLQRIAAHMLVQGEPQYRFDFQPVPTPGLTDTKFTLDGQSLHYYNQRETWHALNWPATNPQTLGTRLQWQTEQAGTNKSLEFSGRWGLIRMLERAKVEPIDNATLQLTWQATPDAPASKPQDDDAQVDKEAHTPAPQAMTYPIRYLMRTEVGSGPLELLALRGFTLPQRIFLTGRNARSQN
ncbi:ImcF-related family protein [Ralstonia flaminis]|uniref:ImcF-related family protein n=1 Tax=Ralstonia flaminis TaxID=3058597 RepID=UPI00293110C3|nr:ImcF-related family protein [Ralstonia sp. LMG 18101]